LILPEISMTQLASIHRRSQSCSNTPRPRVLNQRFCPPIRTLLLQPAPPRSLTRAGPRLSSFRFLLQTRFIICMAQSKSHRSHRIRRKR
jgi:hypothetical protein